MQNAQEESYHTTYHERADAFQPKRGDAKMDITCAICFSNVSSRLEYSPTNWMTYGIAKSVRPWRHANSRTASGRTYSKAMAG